MAPHSLSDQLGEPPGGPPPAGIGILRGNALPIEVCQIAFIGLYAGLSKMISTRQKTKDSTVG